MRVTVVSSLFPTDSDPTRGIFIYRQVKAVRDLGVDAKVLCPMSRSRPRHLIQRIARWAEWGGVPVRYFANWHVPIGVSATLHGRLLLRALRKVLRDEQSPRPDVYHAHWLFPTAWATTRAVANSGVPVIASARGSDVHRYPMLDGHVRVLTREAMRGATIVTSVSRALAELAQALGPPGLKVEVVHNGVDDLLFCPPADRRTHRGAMGLSGDCFYWVSVCRLVREKGIEELAGAFTTVTMRFPRARLLVVGDGPGALSLQRRVAEQGVADRIVFVGRCRPEEVVRWLQAADAFVLASYAEGLPNVVLEAMAAGLPVVATDVGGTKEAVVHGVSGLLVTAREVAPLAEAMLRISRQSGLAAQFGSEGRKRIEQYFGWRASARRWIEMYETALRADRSHA